MGESMRGHDVGGGGMRGHDVGEVCGAMTWGEV